MFYRYAINNPSAEDPIVYACNWNYIKPTGESAANMFTDRKLKGNTAVAWSIANTSDMGCFTLKP